jgi:predicted aspartyl protease
MGRQLLLAMSLAAGLAMASATVPGAAKCKLVRIEDWPVRLVGNHILADGAINGQKIGIMLDTGASRSMILRSAAVRLDLPRREAKGIRVFGLGGESRVDIATVDDLKIGEGSTKGLQLFVAGERDFGEGIAVVLGEDFLRRFDVEFDLAHRGVRLYQPRDCDGVSLAYWTTEIAGEVEIEPIDEVRPQINLTVHINGQPIRAMLDSGAASSMLTTQDAASLGVTPETPGVVAGTSLGGLGAKSVDSWVGPFQSFAIGNERIPDIRIRFADLYKDVTYAETGSHLQKQVVRLQPMLLGADFLRAHRMLVAHSQRKLYFTYVGGPVFQAGLAVSGPGLFPDGDKSSKSGGN